jgi:hypothetical protein
MGSVNGCSGQARAAILGCVSTERNSELQFEPRDQFEQRQKKLEQIQALGFDVFPREFRWTDTPSGKCAWPGVLCRSD